MPLAEIREIPANARLLAWDERRRKVVAYDANRRLIGVLASTARHAKRDGTSCSLIDQSTLDRVSGYHLLEESASTQWGPDWDTALTNPPEYPNLAASACVTGDPSTITLAATPSCTSSNVNTNSTTAQADGSLTLSYTKGTSTTVDFTVSGAAVFPTAAASVTAQVNMPQLQTQLESVTGTFSISNQDTSTTTASGNTLRDTTVRTTASAGQACSLALTNMTCTATGTGTVQLSATGWLWFNYGTQRNGHYKWAVSIDQTISDITQRSSYMNFEATTTSSGITNAAASCAPANALVSTSSGSAPDNTSSPSHKSAVSTVAVAVPVALVISAMALIIVFFFLWRSRRSRYPHRRDGSATDLMSQTGTRLAVTPIWLPPPSSAPSPPSSTPRGLHTHGSSIDAGVSLMGAAVVRPEKQVYVAGQPQPPAYSESTIRSDSSGLQSPLQV